MLDFNNNHIFTGYIKQLLASFNLPGYKVYKKDYYDYLATYGVEDPRIIASEEKGAGVYPDHMLYVNYIKDNIVQRYYNGTWHPTTHHYHYNKKELNQTRTLKVKDNVYTSDVHEYLGEYLRFQRDYNNLDLMPLYNCFSNRICPLLQTSFNVPLYVPNYHDDGTISDTYDVRKITIDSSDSTYKIYMFPIKLFEQYTIALSASEADIFCGLYGAYFDTRDKFSVLPTLTYQHYSPMQFTRPVLYNKLSIENITAGEVRAAELAQVEKNLKMFIRVPANTSSSITVLEGDYTAYNKSIFGPKLQWNEDDSKVNFTEDTDYAYTTYYYDDWIARFFGKNITQRMDTTTDYDDNDFITKTTLNISTVFDYIPSKPNAEIMPYSKEQAEDRFKAFFYNSEKYSKKTTITLNDLINADHQTGNETYTASISGSNPKILVITGNYYKDISTNETELKTLPFTYPKHTNPNTQIKANFYKDMQDGQGGFTEGLEEPLYHIPDEGANPDNIIIFPDKENRYYPTYIDPKAGEDVAMFTPKAIELIADNKLRAQYTITIIIPVSNSFIQEDFDKVTIKLTDEEVGVYFEDNQTPERCSITTEEYLIYKSSLDTDEPLDYNVRNTALPVFPVDANNTEIGTCEVSESISNSEVLKSRAPTIVENGFIAFGGQAPTQYVLTKTEDGEEEITANQKTSGTLYNYAINSRFIVDQVNVVSGLYRNDVYFPILPTSTDVPQNIQYRLAMTSETSSLQLDIERAATITIYCDTPNPNNNKLLLSYKRSEQPVYFNQDGTPVYTSLQNCNSATLYDNYSAPSSHKVVFDLKNGGSYIITGLFDDTRQPINISFIEVVYNFLPSRGWEASTNKFVTNFETAGWVDYYTTDAEGNQQSYQELTNYPTVEERKFVPITNLQLLQYNTGTSYPFADRLLEYLIGNTISQVDKVEDNVRRVQKVMRDNGNEFDIDGAWDGKMRNIIYDYMTNGHPNGETFSIFVNHDVLGYVDKDAERLYTSWIRQICCDKDGKPLIETDSEGKPIYKVINKYLITNGLSQDGIPEKNDKEGKPQYLTDNTVKGTDTTGRFLIADDATYEPVYKSKYVPTGTIMNADIYSGTGRTTN